MTPAPSWSASKAKPEAGAPVDPKAAQADAAKRAYEGGVKSYTSGKHQNAVDQLSVALRGGGLSSAEMARGLYYRGLAYKKLSKPGLAISDLTSALWLKNGLSEADRKSALAERAEAYKAAGLGDGNSGADSVARSDPASEKQAAAPGAAVPAPVPTPAANTIAQAPAAPASNSGATFASPASDAGGIPQPLSLGGESAAAPPPRTVRSEAASGMNQAAALEQPYATTANVAAAPASSQPVLSAASMNSAPSSSATGGSGTSTVAGFFSNLFSGSGSASQSPAAVTTASTQTAAPATPQTSSWADSTSLSQSKTKADKKTEKQAAKAVPAPIPVQTAAAAPAAAAPAKVKGGKFKLHIAAVRSREEADALAQKLMSQHGAAFASRTPAVDEAVIGSMGKFYRVRVGSYVSAEEPRSLCNTLRNSGYDCLVVSN